MLKPFLFVFKELEREKESHTVGLELFVVLYYQKQCLSHHPTQWAWNQYVLELLEDEEIFQSPSHTVGLEQVSSSLSSVFLSFVVTIPHGELGTARILAIEKNASQLPSHTVGLELDPLRKEVHLVPFKSPSHTVGLKQGGAAMKKPAHQRHHPTRWAWNWKAFRYRVLHPFESPSHTVGLERDLEVLRITCKLTKSPSHTVGLEHHAREAKYFLPISRHHPTRWA